MTKSRPFVLALAMAGAMTLAVPARAQEPRPMPTPKGVTRSLDLRYEPSVPDSMLPLALLYRELKTEETLSAYVGALRQDLPVRTYPVVVDNQAVHLTVDGLDGQSHLAIMLMVPWVGKILPWPYGLTSLVVKVDDGPEQKSKLMLTPGGNFYVPSQRPLPVSNPTLVTIPLAPGRHRIAIKLKDLDAAYAFLMLGQPQLTPPAIERALSR